MSPRILVVDDDREVMRLVHTYLEQSGYEVLVACDGETALHILRRECPDLVLLDLMPPGRDGVVNGDVSLAAMPLVVLTARVEAQGQIVGLALGADDGGNESFDSREAASQVRAVLRHVRGEPNATKAIQVGGLVIDQVARRVEVGNRLVHLTPTEFALLRALAEQPGHALTRQEMIEEGLGYGYEGLERTVDSHVKNLRHKLDEADGAAHLIETVFGVGYRLAAG
jgi:two-component system alkaline phosphatase synthesis response regulator PhoP